MSDLSTYSIDLENATLCNKNYRNVLFTSKNQQLVLMSLLPNEDIPFEIHPNNDQFIRIEKGTGKAYIGKNKEKVYYLSDGISITVPAGTWHQIVNNSSSENLKLYTIYSPPHHPDGLINPIKPLDEK